MTLKRQSEAGVAELVAALEHAWDAIAQRHEDLPAAALILGQGSGRRGGALVLGHFAAERWQPARGEGGYVHEVLIGGEGLQHGPGELLATLLHEGAHAIAMVRGIQDTSRQGRYHNVRYKQIAEEVGLRVQQDPVIGWSLTSLPDATATAYAATIRDLDDAITLHRRSESTPAAAAAGNLQRAVCACPRRIRVAPGTLAQGPIICAVCSQQFQPRDQPTVGATPRGPAAPRAQSHR